MKGGETLVVPEADIVLRDGSTVHVRPATPEDEPRLRAFLASLSDESRWFRFFSAGVNLDAAARSAAGAGRRAVADRAERSGGHRRGHGTYIARGARPGGGRLRRRRRLARSRDRHRPARPSRPGRVRRGHRDVHWRRSCRPTTACSTCSTTPVSWCPRGSRRERSRSSSRPRSRATRDIASRSASAPPTSRPWPTSCDPRRSWSSGRRVGRERLAARSCATSSPGLLRTAAPRQRAWRGGRRPADGPRVSDIEGDVELAVIAVPAAAVIETARRVCGEGRARARGPDGRLRRGRPGGPCAPGRAARRLPRGGHAHGRPELPRGRQPPSPDRAQRHLRPRDADAGQRRLRLPERGVRDRGDRRGGGARDRAVVVRVHGRQGRPVGQRLPRVLGAGPRHRRSCWSTWSRSATRAGSGGSRGGSRRRSRSSRSRAAAPRPAIAPRPPTPARCSPPRT